MLLLNKIIKVISFVLILIDVVHVIVFNFFYHSAFFMGILSQGRIGMIYVRSLYAQLIFLSVLLVLYFLSNKYKQLKWIWLVYLLPLIVFSFLITQKIIIFEKEDYSERDKHYIKTSSFFHVSKEYVFTKKNNPDYFTPKPLGQFSHNGILLNIELNNFIGQPVTVIDLPVKFFQLNKSLIYFY